jgi:hypothetical protein
MSPPDERSMGGCSCAVYSKKRTHDYGRVRRIVQPRNVTGIRYNIDPPKLPVDPDIDVAESALYLSITVTVAYLSVIFAKYCGLALKHLLAFMHWVAMPA